MTTRHQIFVYPKQIGKEMFYSDSSYAIKAKTFIFVRRLPLCDIFGCYCEKYKFIYFWGRHFFPHGNTNNLVGQWYLLPNLGRGWGTKYSQNPGIARRGGGLCPLPGFVHNSLRALQSDHSSPKSDNFPQKCTHFPRILVRLWQLMILRVMMLVSYRTRVSH